MSDPGAKKGMKVNTDVPAKRASKRLSILFVALLSAVGMLCMGASSASAVLLGINEGGSETSQDMEAIKRSGTNLYQMGIVWNAVNEHGNWRESAAWEASIDKRVELAAKNEVDLIGGLYGRGSLPALHQYYLSNEWGEYMEFVWTVVQRYGRGGAFWSAHPTLPYRPITIWTVWNEPNLAWNNPGETVLPQKYAEFLIATSNTIKAAQNAIRKAGEPVDTKVIHAGLYQSDVGMAVGSFIEKASKVSGYAASFDGMGLHPYSFAGTEAEKLAGLASNIEKARNAVNNWVGTAKPIWISELGWPLGGTKEPSVSEAEQARLLTASFNWLKANAAANKIELITWYLYSDIATETWDGYCGLRNGAGKYRESWYAFQEQAGVPKWPLPEPKGEDDFQGPHPVGQASGTVDAFFRTTSNGLGHDWFRPGIGWASTTEAGPTLASDPHPVSHPNGAVDVFFRTTSNGLGHDWFNPGIGWASTTEAGPALASDPYPIGQPSGVVDIFFRTTSNGLGHDWFNPSTGWASATEAGPALASDPHPVLHDDGTVDIFFRTTSGGLGHDWFRPGTGWASTTEAGPALASDPHPVLHADGTVDIFFRTTSNGLGHDWFRPGTGWASTTEAGPALASDPRPILQTNGVVDVFFRTTSNGLGHDWFNPSTGWASTTEAGPALASEPHVQTMTDGTVNAFFRTTSGGLGHDWFRPGIGWASTTEAGPALKALELPKATTEAASNVKVNSATLSGTVNAEGAPTNYYFEYGTTTSYGSKTPAAGENVGYGTSGVAVSQALTTLSPSTTYHYRVVATSEAGTTKGTDKTFTTEALSIPAIATVLSDGKMLAKTGSPTATAVDESISGVKILNTSVAAVSGTGAVFAAYGENQHVYVKQGLNGAWVDEGGEMKSMSVAVDATNGPYVGVVTNAGQAMVKQGITGSWVNQMAGSSSISLATDAKNGPLIGVLGTNGHAYVKQGSLVATFVDESSGVKALSLATDSSNGPLIGVLTTGGVALVKQGSLTATWVEEFGGVQALSLASDSTNNLLLGVLTNAGEAYVKQGSLTATWVNEKSGVTALSLGSDPAKGLLIGVRTNDGHAYVKQGSLYGEWFDQMGSTSIVSLAVGG